MMMSGHNDIYHNHNRRPPLRAERRPPMPHGHYRWRAGAWAWRNGVWVWGPGGLDPLLIRESRAEANRRPRPVVLLRMECVRTV